MFTRDSENIYWPLPKLIWPNHPAADQRRKQFVLHVLLLGFLAISLFSLLFTVYEFAMRGGSWHLVILAICVFVCLGIVALFITSLRGNHIVPAIVAVTSLFIISLCLILRWGIFVPSALVLFCYAMLMASSLFKAKTSMLVGTIAVVMIGITQALHNTGSIHPDLTWQTQAPMVGDAISMGFQLLLIAFSAWLTTAQLEHALKRLEKSERLLRVERDQLVETVGEQTIQLGRIEMTYDLEMAQLLEWGRRTSALMHDILNPINAASLNLQLAEGGDVIRLEKAQEAIKSLEGMVTSLRSQVKNEYHSSEFSPYEEIERVIQLLEYRCHEMGVEVRLEGDADAFFGPKERFTQVISNLLTNAIDSYQGSKRSIRERYIHVVLRRDGKWLYLTVQDYGCGMTSEVLRAVSRFSYTTKKHRGGTGLGLTIVNTIVEKELGGKVTVSSQINSGTLISVVIPLNPSAKNGGEIGLAQ